MPLDLITARQRLNTILQDDATFLTAAEIDDAITMAVEQVNHDRPRRLVFDIAGDGTQDYKLPSDFQKAFSVPESVEHPAGENPPVFRIRDDDWFIYEDPSQVAGEQLRLRFKGTTPTATETIRVTITTPYALTVSTSTFDSQTIFLALIYKSAVLAFRAIAAKFAQSADPTIDADSVDYGGRSQNYLFLAERYETNYKGVIGLGEDTKAAFSLQEVDLVFDHGEDFLMHPARSR
jgi:hypothetical protein